MKLLYLTLLAACTANLWGQRVTDQRSAEIRGGGGDGKCTIEVVVDDAAEVEVTGRAAVIRTLNGSPATFRRFQCNQEMPANPNNFRFEGVDGRGRMSLARMPSGRGPAVIRIEDPKGGSEGYTFDIFWRGAGDGRGGFDGGGNDRRRQDDGYDNGRRGGYDDGRRGGYDDGRLGSRGGWNDGWGNGSGWSSNGDFNYSGGRPGGGEYRDRNGDRRRLDSARVFIGNSGTVAITFQSDRGRVQFAGTIERRQGHRVLARVNGSGMRGLMEIEMASRTQVARISMGEIDLNWSN